MSARERSWREGRSLVLFADGRSAMRVVYDCPHTGGAYCYTRSAAGNAVRVYVAPGASVEYVEVPDPLTGAMAPIPRAA